MHDYLDDLLVWAIILVVLSPLLIAFLKNKQILIFIIGLLTLLAAVPAAFMLEISISGCCGAPSSGNEGLGYLIGLGLAIFGIFLMVFSKKFAKK